MPKRTKKPRRILDQRPRTLVEAKKLIRGPWEERLAYDPELSEMMSAKESDIDSIVVSWRESDGKIRDPAAIRELICAISTYAMLNSIREKLRKAHTANPGARFELLAVPIKRGRDQ